MDSVVHTPLFVQEGLIDDAGEEQESAGEDTGRLHQTSDWRTWDGRDGGQRLIDWQVFGYEQ